LICFSLLTTAKLEAAVNKDEKNDDRGCYYANQNYYISWEDGKETLHTLVIEAVQLRLTL
jgi:hypothetical protein